MSIWIYYFDGHGGPLLPAGILKHGTDRTAYDAAGVNVEDNYCNYVETLDNLGNPISVAADAAHRYGIELYACFKPYETGISLLLPQGSPEARQWGRLLQCGGYVTWIDPFVLLHPELRIKRRTDDIEPGNETAPITSIRLTKKDDAPTSCHRRAPADLDEQRQLPVHAAGDRFRCYRDGRTVLG